MPTPPLDILTGILRRALFSLAGPDYTALSPLIRQAMAFLEHEDPGVPATQGYAADVASLTAAMIEDSHSPGFIKSGLEILLRLGYAGESLALSFACKDIVSGEHLRAILGALPVEAKLLLANAILRFPRSGRPELQRFAQHALEAAIDQSPDDILVLLDTLHLRGETPCLPLRDECLHGRLGQWLERLVKMDLYPEQVAFLSRMAAALRSGDLAESLLRNAAGLPDDTLANLCRALADQPCAAPPEVAATLAELPALSDDDPRTTLAVLEAVSRMDPARAAEMAAALYAGRASLRRCLLVVPVFLLRPQFPVFIRALPEPLRAVFLGEFLFFLARSGDERLQALLEETRRSHGLRPDDLPPLFTALEREGEAADRSMPPKPRRVRVEPLPEPEAESLLGKLKSLVGLEKAASSGEMKPSVLDALKNGGELVGTAVSGVARPGIELRDVVFTKANLDCVDLSRCVLSRVVFRDCRLKKVDFTLARMAGVRFEACRLDLCRFSGISAKGLVFSGSDLYRAWLDDAEIRELRVTGCAVHEGDFYGLRTADFEASRTLFAMGDFTQAVFSRARFFGVDLEDCVFAKTVFDGLAASGCHVRGTTLSDCTFSSLHTDEPALLSAHRLFVRNRLMNLAVAPQPAVEPVRPGGDDLSLATRLVESWCFDMETVHRRVAVLTHNRRRLDWALEKLGEPDADFLRCLPSLVESPRTWTSKGWVAAVPGRITGHHPSFSAFSAMRHIMGEACPPFSPVQNAVTILGLFAMGSLGTVAQGQASDLDIWVCLADEDASRRQIDRFRKKMDGLRALAASRNIEAHFFVMTDADIRENRLGLGDEEQCGQARAMLLKEEFLRTALFLAGCKPAWWFVAPGIGDEVYARTLDRLTRHGAPAATDILDTGNVRRVEDEAILGASLWTIVKSLENPFKSIMKFALLEKYLDGNAQGTLLCERIKRRLFAGRTTLFDTDPYVLLLDEVRAFHEARNHREALALLRMAFIQKTGIDPQDPGSMTRQDQPGQSGGEGLFRAGYFFDLDECRAVRQSSETAASEPAGFGGIAELTAAGKHIADFLFGTYERIRERLSIDETDHAAEPDRRDLAVFGRRILSRFGARKNKIGRIPFVRPPNGLLQSLEILYDEQEHGFSARGECRSPDGRKAPEYIRSERSLERLAAWLAANGIHSPGVYLKAATVKAPLSVPDIQGLFAALAAAFPVKDTFSPPLAEGLAPERITRALLVINLHRPREEKDITEVGLYYSTNWGELFFVEGTQALGLLEPAPHDFVRYNTGLDVDPLARIETFVPAKAACPRLNLSFYA
ncbi:class I adenylate cyclase [Desulfolutivibrio sp.]|uniref:class I adenylate cyclase n=1 Tax=Desulfolutivibrio sp. TaxID=2773296 RepID=UPI002F969E57